MKRYERKHLAQFSILRHGLPTCSTPPQLMGLWAAEDRTPKIGSKDPVKDLVVVLERPCFSMPSLSPVVAVLGTGYRTAFRG